MEVPVDPGREEALRRWKRWACVGGALLLGPVLGLAGTVLGMILSFRRIESAAAPTPDELAEGVRLSMLSTTAGSVAGAAGLVILGVALLRIRKLRAVAAEAEAAGRSWR